MKATNKIVLYFIMMLKKKKKMELQSTCPNSSDEIIEIVRSDNVTEVQTLDTPLIVSRVFN